MKNYNFFYSSLIICGSFNTKIEEGS